MTPRRQFTLAVVVCAAAAGIVLYAASRSWLVEVTTRPEPLPALTTDRSGGSLVAVLPALALVGLAGAGGLLAARGRARTAVAVLLVVVGLAIPASLFGVVSRSGVALGWVLVSALGGLAVAAVGVLAVRRGGVWPTMGARYGPDGSIAGAGRSVRDGRTEGGTQVDEALGPVGLWDALDRGEDPTMR